MMNKLKEIYERSKCAVLGIRIYDNEKKQITGRGTGFILENKLVTNYHVIDMILDDANSKRNNLDDADTQVTKLQDKEQLTNITRCSSEDFFRCMLGSSEQNGHDYAILDAGIADRTKSSLDKGNVNNLAVGEEVAFLGYPFGAYSLVLHKGIISSIYDSGVAKVFQLDASTNMGNSGGPVLNLETGKVIGVVTRKADGFTKNFKRLKEILRNNCEMLSNVGNQIRLGNINYAEVIAGQQEQLHLICSEIERSANVGIGYAHSIVPILENIDMLLG